MVALVSIRKGGVYIFYSRSGLGRGWPNFLGLSHRSLLPSGRHTFYTDRRRDLFPYFEVLLDEHQPVKTLGILFRGNLVVLVAVYLRVENY